MPSALLQDLRRDIVLACRLLRRRPAFAATAVATLALGLGAPTTIFSVVHAVLLRPLPYGDAERIVRFRIETRGPRGPVGFDAVPAGAALEWAGSSATLAALAIYNNAARTLTTPEGPVRLTGLSTTANLFEVLGTRPIAGHTFARGDGDLRQVVLSYATWQRYFGGAGSAIGAVATLDGVPHRIVGVMPYGFEFPTRETQFWVPVMLAAGGSRGMVLPAIGRMKPDATLPTVAQEARRLLVDMGSAREESTVVVRTLREQMVGGVSRLLWVLMAAVGLVSVIATVNIALLLLTQGAGRGREFSVRLALGATRGRIVRQVTIEGAVLAALGGAAAVIFAAGFLQGLVRIAPPDVPRLHQAALDGPVLAFTAGLVLIATLVFAALSAGRTVTGEAVRALARATTESRLFGSGVSIQRLHALAAAELCLAVVLLVGAGLLLRSFVGLVLVDHGFDTRGALAAQVTLPAARYPTPESRMAFHDRLLEILDQRPGVTTAGLITTMPNRQPTGRFAYDVVPALPPEDPFALKLAEVHMATEGFVESMGLRLLAGRTFRPDDAEGAEPVMVISDDLARMHFAGRNPVGETLYSMSGDRRVIGVVANVRPAPSASPQHDPAAYLPLRQRLDVFRQFATMSIVLRGPDAEALVPELRAVVRSLDPELPVFNIRTLDAEVAGLVAGPRFTATVLALFAGVALVMAAIGVYGVVSHAVGRRTREIGVRVALGATRAQILRLILRDGLMVVLIGLAAGLLAAAWLARALTGLLHEVTPADPVALASVGAVLSLVGAFAVYLPAHRATRMSALAALRED